MFVFLEIWNVFEGWFQLFTQGMAGFLRDGTTPTEILEFEPGSVRLMSVDPGCEPERGPVSYLAADRLLRHAFRMWESEPLAGLDSRDRTPESICACVAKIFHVKDTEVALLELGGSLLNFLYPAELKAAGAIPLSSSAVAARTARSKQAELFNSFTKVKHSSIFELVKLGDTGLDAQIIQKLMSAPVLAGNGKVIGVIQISRKAPRPAAAGPDFTPDDLRKLESVALFVGKLMAEDKGIAQASSG